MRAGCVPDPEKEGPVEGGGGALHVAEAPGRSRAGELLRMLKPEKVQIGTTAFLESSAGLR